MAQIDKATLSVGIARFYTAPVGTALSELVVWKEMGHTSIDEVLTVETEGGETTTLGSLQKKAIKNSRKPIIDKFRINLQQFDVDSLKLYYGSNAVVGADNMVEVPETPISTECAWKMVAEDGLEKFTIYAPKADIFRAEGVEIARDESLSSLPLDVTPLTHEDNLYPYKVSAIGAVSP